MNKYARLAFLLTSFVALSACNDESPSRDAKLTHALHDISVFVGTNSIPSIPELSDCNGHSPQCLFTFEDIRLEASEWGATVRIPTDDSEILVLRGFSSIIKSYDRHYEIGWHYEGEWQEVVADQVIRLRQKLEEIGGKTKETKKAEEAEAIKAKFSMGAVDPGKANP